MQTPAGVTEWRKRGVGLRAQPLRVPPRVGGAEQRDERRLVSRRVLAGGLAERCGRTFDVKEIIDDLECESRRGREQIERGGMRGGERVAAACAEGEQHALIEKLQATATFPGAVDIIRIDGLRVEYADGFGLARASNTTPVVVLRFEADNAKALARIQGEFRRVLTAVKPGIVLPF